MSEAIFAGGCFWCTESDLRKMDGVIDVVSGYVGGEGAPSYYNHRGYREGILVRYDNTKTSFKRLCQFFLDHIDPTDASGQFYDRGASYETAIYYKDATEKEVAEGLLCELRESGLYDEPIAVKILPRDRFYQAEEEHQRYAEKNPAHYDAYRRGSGRTEFALRTCMVRDEKNIKWKD